MNKALPAIFSLSGPELTAAEKSFFQDANPLGFILFARNCENPTQLKKLNHDLKSTLGRDCPILIDQEGGRVQRLKPPHWRDYPPMKYFGDLYNTDSDKALEEIRFETLRLAEELVETGINVNCAPVLDILTPETHDVIGDRAFSANPEIAARLGLSVCRHFLAVGITPVIKHIPGHGRARADSHHALPIVETDLKTLQHTDFKPFRDISSSEIAPALWAMTAHINFPAIDAGHPVSVSAKIIKDIIRKDIGFDGILIGDDLDMKALDAYGSASEKALASLSAGCDLALYCAGDLKIMEKLAENLPKIRTDTLKRLQKAQETAKVAA